MDIITTEEKRRIIEGLELAKELRKEIVRAKRAGIDTTELENRLRDLEQQLQNLKRVYVSATK